MMRITTFCLVLAGAAQIAAAPIATADLGSAWSELRGVRDAIAARIEAGELAAVHAESEKLAPLAQALLASSGDLGPAKRPRLEGAVKQVPKIADALHEAADAGKLEETRRQLALLDGLLELIRVQIPPGALQSTPAPSPDAAAHAAHDHGAAPHDHAPGHAHADQPLAAVDEVPKVTLHVIADEYKFEPRSLSLRVGVPTRIEFQNVGAIEHALIVRAPDGSGDWIHLHAGADASDAATYQIDERGTFRVLCTVPGHTEAGMTGELIVR